MQWWILRRAFGAGLAVFSLLLLIWGISPVQTLTRTLTLYPQDLILAVPNNEQKGDTDGQPIAQLWLEWPGKLRKGDAGTVRLSFEFNALGGEEAGHVAGLALVSRLDLAGIRHTPTGEISQALVREHPVVFLWNLRAGEPGNYAGKTWLHLQSLMLESEVQDRRLLAAQDLEIQVTSLLGLSGDQARVFGAVGLALGAVLGLDGVIQSILRRTMKKEPE